MQAPVFFCVATPLMFCLVSSRSNSCTITNTGSLCMCLRVCVSLSPLPYIRVFDRGVRTCRGAGRTYSYVIRSSRILCTSPCRCLSVCCSNSRKPLLQRCPRAYACVQFQECRVLPRISACVCVCARGGVRSRLFVCAYVWTVSIMVHFSALREFSRPAGVLSYHAVGRRLGAVRDRITL